MQLQSLMYHDIVEEGKENESGFHSDGFNPYKIETTVFRDQLKQFHELGDEDPILVDSLTEKADNSFSWALTFDDGGSSFYAIIAKELEQFKYQAHFFITTSLIGTKSFLNANQILELRKMGHVIGSHSHTHHEPFSSLSLDNLVDEWTQSTKILSEILGESVTVASVPGGYFSKNVAKAASLAGIKVLFTSDPFQTPFKVENCWIFGRYTIFKKTPCSEALAISMGKPFPCLKQWSSWKAKKAAKILLGNYYLDLRKRILRLKK